MLETHEITRNIRRKKVCASLRTVLLHTSTYKSSSTTSKTSPRAARTPPCPLALPYPLTTLPVKREQVPPTLLIPNSFDTSQRYTNTNVHDSDRYLLYSPLPPSPHNTSTIAIHRLRYIPYNPIFIIVPCDA